VIKLRMRDKKQWQLLIQIYVVCVYQFMQAVQSLLYAFINPKGEQLWI